MSYIFLMSMTYSTYAVIETVVKGVILLVWCQSEYQQIIFTVCFPGEPHATWKSVDETQLRGSGSDRMYRYYSGLCGPGVYPHCFLLIMTLTSCTLACCSLSFSLSHQDARSGTESLTSIDTSRNWRNLVGTLLVLRNDTQPCPADYQLPIKLLSYPSDVEYAIEKKWKYSAGKVVCVEYH